VSLLLLRVHRFLFCFISVFLNVILCSAQGAKDKVERLMNTYAGADNFNGSVLVSKRGIVLLEKGYGYRDASKGTRNDEHSIYQAGQCTEVITTEVILQLDSKGRLGLEDRISKYFPDFPNGNRINIRQLMTHTSGIYDYTLDSVFAKNNREKQIKRQTILDLIKSHSAVFDPGVRYSYSASEYFLLGCIIDKVARWNYEYETDSKIFQVCGMKHTGFDFKRLKDDAKTVGYDYLGKDKLVEAPLFDSSYLSAAGALYSTVGDLFKFNQALHWHKLLPKDWQDLAYIPGRSLYALGWKAERIYNKPFVEHEGNIPGFSSFIMRQEDDDLFIVLLSNNAQPPVPLSVIANSILKTLYGADARKTVEKKEGAEEGAQLKKFAGKFEFTPEFYLIFRVTGAELVAISPDEKEIRMIQDGPNTFHTVGVAAKVDFVSDKGGRVNKAILHQGGEDIPGKRVK
jgi:CubicO group peptidase (beta-lactamase class C family)